MLELLRTLNQAVPRYTSYPTAPEWKGATVEDYEQHLRTLGNDPLSLYFHIPFCQSMCLYCGCSVVLNRKKENEERYVEYLLKEIDLVTGFMEAHKAVAELHFGGGTPTKLSIDQLEKIVTHIRNRFSLQKEAVISIEIDPRTVMEDEGAKLRALKEMGFNRVSFGVQDTNEEVQEAIKRRQSYAMTLKTYEWARELAFGGINIDLIYGLPFQTVGTFEKTVEEIVAMRPDRIALFSYAKVPWLKPHQKAIKEETLPSAEEKLQIYLLARKRLEEAGYLVLGMDHFALPQDRMAEAFLKKKLHRNFQGYTPTQAENMVSFGITAIGEGIKGYFQNKKDLTRYYQALDENQLPLERGHLMSRDDQIRKWTIHRLMCDFSLDKQEWELRHGVGFNRYFAEELGLIRHWQNLGMLEESDTSLQVLPLGHPFIRNIASSFDWYLRQEKAHKAFSQSV